MRTIIVLWMIACLAGCSYFVSMDELARNIQAQMQQEFNSNQDYQRYRFTVQKVKIVQRQGNQFKAISHLNYQGEAYPVNVKIFKVDGGYRWSIEEDAFAFIDEIEIEKSNTIMAEGKKIKKFMLCFPVVLFTIVCIIEAIGYFFV